MGFPVIIDVIEGKDVAIRFSAIDAFTPVGFDSSKNALASVLDSAESVADDAIPRLTIRPVAVDSPPPQVLTAYFVDSPTRDWCLLHVREFITTIDLCTRGQYPEQSTLRW